MSLLKITILQRYLANKTVKAHTQQQKTKHSVQLLRTALLIVYLQVNILIKAKINTYIQVKMMFTYKM